MSHEPISHQNTAEADSAQHSGSARSSSVGVRSGMSNRAVLNGGFDGERMYLPAGAGSRNAVFHEIAHAALGHRPSAKNSTVGAVEHHPGKESEAHRLGANVAASLGPRAADAVAGEAGRLPRQARIRTAVLPFLVDGGAPMGGRSIRRLLSLAEYRHDREEAGFLSHQVDVEQALSVGITLSAFRQKLLASSDKATKRSGVLLGMVLHNFKEPEEAGETWNAMIAATRYIRGWERDGRLENSHEDDETTPLLRPGSDKFSIEARRAEICRIPVDQWQAAAVAEMRAKRLSAMGFIALKEALDKASGGRVILRMSRDMQHEFMLQSFPSPGEVQRGSVHGREDYGTDVGELNKGTGLFKASGSYEEDDGVILKSLDLGHKVVDKWENFSHRTEGRQVDPKVDFQFLALLSPKEGSQEVIGANGSVLGDGSYMFTIDPSFHFRYMPAANFAGEGGNAKNFFQFIPHSQLASLGKVVAAGNFEIRGGCFRWIDNGSGHYRVSAGVNEKNASAALRNLGYATDTIAFLSRPAGDLDAHYEAGNKVLEGLPKGEERPAMTPEIRAMQGAMGALR